MEQYGAGDGSEPQLQNWQCSVSIVLGGAEAKEEQGSYFTILPTLQF